MTASNLICQVTRFEMVTPTVFVLSFRTEPRFEFQAGQFISVVVPGAGPKGRDLRRAYSIASPPGRDEVEVCVKIVESGPGTSYLKDLHPGDSFKAVAPYGDFVYHPKPGRHVCFIATGTGIAPFRATLESERYWTEAAESTLCLLGVREESEILYDPELTRLAQTKDFRWITAVSRPVGGTSWAGFRGRVTDYLRSLGSDYPWLHSEFYLCGAGAMIDEVKQLLAERGVQKESIHQEIYYKTPKEPA